MNKFRLLLFFVVFLMLTNCGNRQKNTALTTLKFKIIDADTQQPIPGKLIFLEGDKEVPLNIPDQDFLAPEHNGFYTALGKGDVKIPQGKYTVYAVRGMEYSIDKQELVVKGESVENTWTITREYDPQGYVGCDFHMHTLNSDGNCTEEERVTSLVGEGIEWANSSDHNFVSDFTNAQSNVRANDKITLAPGNELTTNVGHFNIYPLPKGTEPFNHKAMDARELFGYARALSKDVVVQASHPRWDGIDYFGKFDLDPITSETDNPKFSWDFDAMEIMNETIGYGYVVDTDNYHSVWDEWFNMLNKGFRVTGVGNSDSHNLLHTPVGWPRNYVATSTDNPTEVNSDEITKSVVAGKVSVSRGLFVNLTINNQPIGSEVVAKSGKVKVKIEVFAPSWGKAEQVNLYANGREILSKKFEPTTHHVEYLELKPEVDSWYVAKAEGSQNLWPIIQKQGERFVYPIGFTNAIYVDIDGKGFETERDRAIEFNNRYKTDFNGFVQAIAKEDFWFKRQLLAVVDSNSKQELTLLKGFLDNNDAFIRKYTIKRISKINNREAKTILQEFRAKSQSASEKTLIDAMLSASAPAEEKLAILAKAAKIEDLGIRREIISMLSPEIYQPQWHIVGPFDNANKVGFKAQLPPENKVDLKDEYLGKNDTKIKWQKVVANAKGFVDIRKNFEDSNNSVAYAWLSMKSDKEQEAVLIFGSDDGVAVWQNGKEIFRRLVGRSADPHDEVVAVKLVDGENKFLLKVENGGGDWGFYFQCVLPEMLENRK